jgi:PQQ-like domain
VKTVFLLLTMWLLAFTAAQTNNQALWQVNLDALPNGGNNVFYGNSVIYYVKNNQLHVTDVQTGKQLWQVDYSLSNEQPYTTLPVSGEGLIFVHKSETLQALNERTGEQVWAHESNENVKEAPLSIYETGLYYDKGYLFLQTESQLTTLDAKGGSKLWQIEKGEIHGFSDFQVLNDEVALITFLERSGRTLNTIPGIFDLKTGEMLWSFEEFFDTTFVKVLQIDSEKIDLLLISQNRQFKSLIAYDLRSGEILSQCDILTRGSNPQLEFDKLGPVWPGLPMNPDEYVFYDNRLYSGSYAPGSTQNLYSFPLCMGDFLFPPASAETVNETTDRYLLEGIAYYDTAPFSWQAGPFNGNFLFIKDGQLYKVPVPSESSAYLYHNKADDSVYIEPKFADIDPPPYRLIPGIEGKVVKVELMGDRVYILLDDSTLQVINFDSLETLLKAQTNLDVSALTNVTFYQQNDVLVLDVATINSHDLIAYQLPKSTEQ